VKKRILSVSVVLPESMCALIPIFLTLWIEFFIVFKDSIILRFKLVKILLNKKPLMQGIVAP